MKRFLKWCLILVSIPLVLAVIALGAAYFLAGTDSGFRIAAREAAKRVPGLELDEVGGNVLSGLSGDGVGFENDAFRVDVAGLDSEWRAGCLLQREFCLDRLVVDEVVFAPKPSDEPAPPASTDDIVLPEIVLPIDVTVDELLVRRFVFRPPGDAAEQVIEDVRLAARTEPGGVVVVEGLSLGTSSFGPGLAANASGQITTTGDWPIDLDLVVEATDVVAYGESPAAPADPATPAAGRDDTASRAPDAGAGTDAALVRTAAAAPGAPDAGEARPDGTGVAPADVPPADAAARPVSPVAGAAHGGDPGDDPTMADFRVAIALDDTVADLALRADVTGDAEAALEGRVQPLKKALPADVTLSSASLGWPLDTHALVEATDFSLDVDGTLADYRLALATSVAGAQVPETDIDIAGVVNTERLVLPDVGVRTLGGSVNGTAALSWHDTLSWLAALNLENLEPGRLTEALEGRLGGAVHASGTVEGGSWTLVVDGARIEGTLAGYPFTLDAKASKGLDEVWRLDRLTLDNGENRVRASGTVGETVDASLDAALPQLENLWPGLGGALEATLVATGPIAAPDVALDVSSDAVSFNDVAVEGLAVTGKIDDAALEPSALSVKVDDVRVAGQQVQNIALGLEGTRADHALSLFADGPQATAIDLDATGGLTESFDWSGLLQAVTLEVPAHTIRLAEPTALEWDNADKLFGVDAHCWVTEESDLCLENDVVAAPTGTAEISLDTYPLARLNPFLPAESTLAGALGLDATLDWGDGQPGGFAADVAARISDGGVVVRDAYDEPVEFTYSSLALDATVDPTNVDASLALDSDDLGSARVTANVGLGGETMPLEGTVALDGLDLGVAQAFAPDLDEIGGTLSANGTLSGEATDPRFDGRVVLDSPTVRGQALPLEITGGQVVTTVRGKRADIGGEVLAGGGRVDVDGSADWAREAWRADVTLKGDDLNVATDPLLESSVNHDITIRARPGDIRVAGTVDIPMADIDVADLPAGAATLSDDIVVIEDEEAAEAELAAAGGDLDGVGAVDPPGETSLRVDVDVTLGDDVNLNAYGLVARLTGDIGIGLRSPNPVQLAGEVQVVDGIFRQYGQNLEASGRVLFVGPVPATRLDIEAIRRIESGQNDRIAGIRIGGDVEEPEIELFTDPADKSDESILSYIVLGRDIGETSDQEANLLATAALALTVKGGKAFGQGIADSLGIEEFGLETRGKGDDTELVVSGRLNDRLLLKYGQSVFEAQKTLYLRYDLAKNLYLEAAQGVNRAVDLFYEFSF